MDAETVSSLQATGKRKRSSDSSSPPPFSINDLNDCLLIEILYRLPCIKSAVRCKLVSKRWYSLISSSYFISRFLDNNSNSTNIAQTHFTFFIYTKPKLVYNKIRVVKTSKEPDQFSSPAFALINKKLPSLASCDDIFLCRKRIEKESRDVYCIYNPITTQCVAIPPTTKSYRSGTRILVGLLFEPYCYQNNIGKYVVNDTLPRFRVVQIPDIIQDSLTLEIFCSETNKWSELDVPYFHRRDFLWQKEAYHINGVPYNGMLHWVTTSGKIVAFNPYNIEQYQVIDCPTMARTHPLQQMSCCLGVFQGRQLRLLQMTLYPHSHDHILKLWKLKDHKGERKWSLKCKIFWKELVSENSWVQKQVKEGWGVSGAVAIHPIDGDVVYLHVRFRLVLCNVRTGQLKLAGDQEISGSSTSPYFDSTKVVKHCIPHDHYFHALPYVIPPWPTPIPALPN